LSLYQCLAFPIKENGNSFHWMVSSDMPFMRMRSQICLNSHRCEYGFNSLSPKKGSFWTNSMKSRLISKPDVVIGSECSGGLRCVPIGLVYW
jgi:hypothetical protein